MDKKLKIALAQLNPLVGDVSGNVDKLITIRSGLSEDVDILVAPELYVSGYPIDDLVLREDFLTLVKKEIDKLKENTKDNKSAIIVGAPRKDKKSIKNYFGKKVDLIISDMAVNTTGDKSVDSLVTGELCIDAMNFAVELLNKKGSFISKLFMGSSFNEIVALGKKSFLDVDIFKPPSSRKDSKENFIICRNLR